MKALLISFSGRNGSGNCLGTLKIVGDILEEEGVEVNLIDILDHDIRSCFGCDYQCFDPEDKCPVDDDVEEIYREIVDHDMIFMDIPVYSGAPCSNYFTLRERSQSVFYDPEFYDRYERVSKYFIIIGNEEAGGKESVELISADLKDHEDLILLQSHNYSQSSISGRLAENDDVKKRLRCFVEKALEKHTKMKEKIRSLEDLEQIV